MAAKRVSRRPGENQVRSDSADVSENRSPSELIVVAAPDGRLAARVAAINAGVDEPEGPATLAGVVLEPLFGSNQARVRSAAALLEPSNTIVPDLSRYYRVDAPESELEQLAERLRALPEVEAAYIKPPAEPAEFRLNEMRPATEEAPATTPNFTPRQGYLSPAPVGIEAGFANALPGGRGADVAIIDIEWGWRFNHEDLRQVQGGVVSGTNSTDDNHGTAVLGEYSGDLNPFGVTGIAPEAHASAVSLMTHTTSQAIRIAADRLRAGDIILLEVHRRGPNGTGVGQFGYIAIEWWPDDFDAIRYALSRGIIVVEAAGNGGQNLDAAIYNMPQTGFPPGWRNPFNPANPSSGAVLVGAGNPPAGTHGRNAEGGWGETYADRARCFFSNYGARVDAQGWGWEVTSSGYGDLQGGSDRDFWYTDIFSGTSSASPIVVGALACVQGVLRARGAALLTSEQARQLLRTTGSPQQAGPSFTFLPNMSGSGYPQVYPARPATERIGNRPNLRQMIAQLLPATTAHLFRYWNPQGVDHFYTTDWNELGNGAHGWQFERIQCDVHSTQQPGTVPLYRYWNAQHADHFYTTDWNELGNGAHGWVFERIQCYVFSQPAPGLLPLYRYWNPQGADHFYTTDWNELGAGAHGWTFERIQCYVLPPTPGPTPGADPNRPATFTTAATSHGSGVMPSSFAPAFESAQGGAYVAPTFSTAATAAGGGIPSSFRTSGSAQEKGAAAVPSTFAIAPSADRGESAETPSTFSIAGKRKDGVTITITLPR
jgi:hypothetical protein